MVRARIYVYGLVQGVNFRHHTSRQASALDLKGWVRNLSDGRVEIVVEGTRINVEKLSAWCRRGSPQAKVKHVDLYWEPYVGDFRRFSITY